MDESAEKSQKQNELDAIEAYLSHPLSVEILKDNAEEQEGLIHLILERPVVNIETFLAREQALGHLRGLRRGKAIIMDKLEDIKTELKELP